MFENHIERKKIVCSGAKNCFANQLQTWWRIVGLQGKQLFCFKDYVFCKRPQKYDLSSYLHKPFPNFSCVFLNPNIFFSNLNSNCCKNSVTKNCSDLSLLNKLVFQQFFLTFGRNNFVTKYNCFTLLLRNF